MVALFVLALALGSVASPHADSFDSFIWASGEIRGKMYEKAAVLVPVEIPGVETKLYGQLDTGSDATVFYGNLLRRHGVPVDSGGAIPLRFRWFGHSDKQGPLETPGFVDWTTDADVNPQSDDPSEHIIGSIGLDKVVGKVLILDFPSCKYAVVSDTLAVRQLLPDSVNYVDAAVAYNKFFLSVGLGADTLQAVRFDSGSSSFMLILPYDWWQWATGLSAESPTVVKDTIPSWGKGVETWTAPAKYELTFGQIRIPAPMVTYIDWPDSTLTNARIMGNAPFYNDYIVVVDCIRQKFGVAGRVPAHDSD